MELGGNATEREINDVEITGRKKRRESDGPENEES